jgi:hypothetical protein
MKSAEAFGSSSVSSFCIQPSPLGKWLPGMDSHHHGRLQRAMSYLLDDPAKNWWPARVTLPVQRIKSPLHHFNACRPKWCSWQDSHLHCRRSRRRVSAGWTTRAEWMEPPAGAAPARLPYKGSLQAAARRQKGRSLQCCPLYLSHVKRALCW